MQQPPQQPPPPPPPFFSPPLLPISTDKKIDDDDDDDEDNVEIEKEFSFPELKGTDSGASLAEQLVYSKGKVPDPIAASTKPITPIQLVAYGLAVDPMASEIIATSSGDIILPVVFAYFNQLISALNPQQIDSLLIQLATKGSKKARQAFKDAFKDELKEEDEKVK